MAHLRLCRIRLFVHMDALCASNCQKPLFLGNSTTDSISTATAQCHSTQQRPSVPLTVVTLYHTQNQVLFQVTATFRPTGCAKWIIDALPPFLQQPPGRNRAELPQTQAFSHHVSTLSHHQHFDRSYTQKASTSALQQQVRVFFVFDIFD